MSHAEPIPSQLRSCRLRSPPQLPVGVLVSIPWRTNGGYGSIGRAIVNDWQINGTLGVFTGTPFTVRASGAVLNTPGNQQTADLVGDVRKLGGVGSSGLYYDPNAWAQPEGVRFGNTERNQFYGPGGWNVDASLFRAFPIGDTRRLEFRVEAFNVTNTPVFGNPAVTSCASWTRRARTVNVRFASA